MWLIAAALVWMMGCTGSTPFHLQYQSQNFASLTKVNTKLDMLWVVDNSGSMEPEQKKVRAGIQQFAQTYMKPTWDIRVASITVDTYLADPTFWAGPAGVATQPSYLTTVRTGTSNYNMGYLNGVTSGGVPKRSKHYYDATSQITASSAPTGFNPFTMFNQFQPSAYSPPAVTYNNAGQEDFLAAGMRIIDSKPQMGPNWSKLLIGNHDGPELSMCWDNDISSPQFISGVTACYHRDDPADAQYHEGIANCANPAAGEAGESQCVNTFANNTNHTGLPFISTIPPAGVPGDQAWINGLIANFQVQLTPSTVGDGCERAFQSVLQFLHDNEAPGSPTAFFRPDSLRVIVFVGDEDDQSQTPDPNQYLAPMGTGHGQGAKLHFISDASNPTMCKVTYPAPANGTYYPTGDPGFCIDPAWLIPISTVKTDLDNFFHQLDGTTASVNPNYFVATITTINSASFVGSGLGYIAQRYPALANAVGNGSLVLDLTSSDYTPLLASVGNNILQAKAVFTLKRAPDPSEAVVVTLIHANGTSTKLTSSQFTVSGTTLTITDLNVIASFGVGDNINIGYQPLTIY
jgi:hypothetical protein